MSYLKAMRIVWLLAGALVLAPTVSEANGNNGICRRRCHRTDGFDDFRV